MRQLIEHHDCPVLVMMWRLEITEERRSILIWDAESETMWRVHAGDENAQWEGWPGSSREEVLSEDYMGVLSRGYAHGFGKVPASEEVKHFVQTRGSGLFAAAF